MPIRVKLRVKQRSSLPVNEPAKKQQMTNVPCIRVTSEIVTRVEEVTVKREEIDDGSIACELGASESALCEPPCDPHLSHTPSTSSTTSNQCTSQLGPPDNAEMCAFECIMKSDLVDSLSTQDSESPAMNDVFSELQREEELEYEEVAQNATALEQGIIPFVLNNKRNKLFSRWDERCKELVEFKAINGHTHVYRSSGQLGRWVNTQRRQYRLLKEGKHSALTSERREKLESIGFTYICRPSPTIISWDQRFQELVDFKKVNGHTIVPTRSGPLGSWVSYQRTQYRLLKEGKQSLLTIERCEKLECIGFTFICCPSSTIIPWDQRFQELVDFNKINGHTIVPQGSGPLGKWVGFQGTQYRLLEEGKQSLLTNERREKLENIGFTFICHPSPTIIPWDQRFQELVDFNKINGHANVPQRSGPLGRWVVNQRKRYRLLKEGKQSYLTMERRDKLDSIGLVFNFHKKS
eukprot:scaffold4862_cov70-Attheya_sp.AAC.1